MTEQDVQHLSNAKTVRLLLEAALSQRSIISRLVRKGFCGAFGTVSWTTEEMHYLLLIRRHLSGRSTRLPALSSGIVLLVGYGMTQISIGFVAKVHNAPMDRYMFMLTVSAGSGKSTLMKFIYSHPKTKEYLAYWAGESPLTIAGFFFSYLGAEIQKDKTSKDLCDHFQRKIAVHEATLSIYAFVTPTPQNGRILDKYSTHKQRQIPRLRTS